MGDAIFVSVGQLQSGQPRLGSAHLIRGFIRKRQMHQGAAQSFDEARWLSRFWVGLLNNQSNGDARKFFPERVAPNEWIVSGLVLNAGERGAVFRIGCEGR